LFAVVVQCKMVDIIMGEPERIPIHEAEKVLVICKRE
jgi:hypothetical protein